jgi:hypothetical protein
MKIGHWYSGVSRKKIESRPETCSENASLRPIMSKKRPAFLVFYEICSKVILVKVVDYDGYFRCPKYG